MNNDYNKINNEGVFNNHGVIIQNSSNSSTSSINSLENYDNNSLYTKEKKYNIIIPFISSILAFISDSYFTIFIFSKKVVASVHDFFKNPQFSFSLIFNIVVFIIIFILIFVFLDIFFKIISFKSKSYRYNSVLINNTIYKLNFSRCPICNAKLFLESDKENDKSYCYIKCRKHPNYHLKKVDPSTL